jgi:hypothetical protein
MALTLKTTVQWEGSLMAGVYTYVDEIAQYDSEEGQRETADERRYAGCSDRFPFGRIQLKHTEERNIFILVLRLRFFLKYNKFIHCRSKNKSAGCKNYA